MEKNEAAALTGFVSLPLLPSPSLRPSSPLFPFLSFPSPPSPLSETRPFRDTVVFQTKISTASHFSSQMALSDSKVLFWNGKVPSKSIHFDAVTDKDRTEQPAPAPTAVPTLCGMPLKYISYVSPPCLAPRAIFRVDGGYSL
jgi:hypothetical protein